MPDLYQLRIRNVSEARYHQLVGLLGGWVGRNPPGNPPYPVPNICILRYFYANYDAGQEQLFALLIFGHPTVKGTDASGRQLKTGFGVSGVASLHQICTPPRVVSFLQSFTNEPAGDIVVVPLANNGRIARGLLDVTTSAFPPPPQGAPRTIDRSGSQVGVRERILLVGILSIYSLGTMY